MTGESMYPVLLIGHRHPDTDAICSALAYANFYHWQTGREAVACYLDDLAPETAWLLNHVGVAAPRPIADVYLRVADVMETQAPILGPDQTLREAGQLMQLHQVRAARGWRRPPAPRSHPVRHTRRPLPRPAPAPAGDRAPD